MVILAACFLLVGLGVILYYPVQSGIWQQSVQNEITTFEKMLADAQQNPKENDEQIYPELLEQMQNYNQQLYQTRQHELTDAWSYTQAPEAFAAIEMPSEIIGILKLPSLGEELPIYLGATEAHMQQGVAILWQTSMPVGGVNTNCVIAGHRGYGGSAIFRNLHLLQPGDRIFLQTYWQERVYQVVDTAIILPDDIEAVRIQPDRELVTLVTCHPYRVNTHRYLVYCEPVQEQVQDPSAVSVGEEQHIAAEPAAEDSAMQSSKRWIILERWLPWLAVPLLLLAIWLLLRTRKRDRQSARKRKEDHGKENP